MKKSDIENVRTVLKKISDAVSPTGSKFEILLDSLATALKPLAKTPPKRAGLEIVLKSLKADVEIGKKLEEIYEELQGVLESKSYGDEDDEDDEETLTYLIEDFADCLYGQLDIWENECNE